MTEKSKRFQVALSMRGERDVGLTPENHLLLRHGLDRLDMGKLTISDIDSLIENLERLKTHLDE